jgi:hypothetical protein
MQSIYMVHGEMVLLFMLDKYNTECSFLVVRADPTLMADIYQITYHIHLLFLTKPNFVPKIECEFFIIFVMTLDWG